MKIEIKLSEDIPKHPTHAVKAIDNSMGDSDIYYTLAYKRDGGFYSHVTDVRLLEFDGDEILECWELSTDNSTNIEITRDALDE